MVDFGFYMDSIPFLNDRLSEELSAFSSAASTWFIDKSHFYSHCREGDQDTNRSAYFWYTDFVDSESRLMHICDALCVDRKRFEKLFRLLMRWEKLHPGKYFPVENHLDSIKRYLIQDTLLRSAYSTEHFTVRTQSLSVRKCFLNLYTYPESHGLCLYACCSCAGQYTVPGGELTTQISHIPMDCIALRDDHNVADILPALCSANIVTNVERRISRGKTSLAICRYDKAALARFTHINRSFLGLRGSCDMVDPNISF